MSCHSVSTRSWTPAPKARCYGWSVSDDLAQRTAGDPGWRRPTFRAGDALLFDEMMLHRTGADPSMPDTRYAIEMWFFAPSADTQWVEIPFVL